MKTHYVACPQSANRQNFYIRCFSFEDGDVRVTSFKEQYGKYKNTNNWIADMSLDEAEHIAQQMSDTDKNNIFYVEYVDYDKNGHRIKEESDNNWYRGVAYNDRKSKKIWREMQRLIK